MENIFKKVGKISIVVAMLFVAIFGVFALEEVEVNAKPNETITLPGGTDSSGELFADFEFEEDSPIDPSDAKYNKGLSDALVLENPKGNYYTRDAVTYYNNVYYNPGRWPIAPASEIYNSISEVQKTSDGYLVGHGFRTNMFTNQYGNQDYISQTVIKKISKNTENLMDASKDSAYGWGRDASERVLNDQSENEAIFKTLTPHGRILTYDINGKRQQVNQEVNGYVPGVSSKFAAKYSRVIRTPLDNGTGYASSSTTPSGPGSTINNTVFYSHKYNMQTNTIVQEIERQVPFAVKNNPNASIGAQIYSLSNNKNLIVFHDSPPFEPESLNPNKIFSSIYMYDENLNNPQNVYAHAISSISFLGDSLSNNKVFFVKTLTEHLIIEIDSDTGNIYRNFDVTSANFIPTQIKSLSTQQNGVDYYIVGTADAKGILSGYASPDSSGVVMVGVSEDDSNISNRTFKVNSASFLKTQVQHTIQYIEESGDGTKMDVFGYAENNGDMFTPPASGYINKNAAFVGNFEKEIDRSPKLLKPNNINIVLSEGLNASQIDAKMLQFMKDDMNGETNRYDDYTTNAELLERINQNVYNAEYKSATIDWEKFGLERTTNNKGEDTYKVGSHEVTYGVTDGQLNQSVVSGPVNICTPETVTDKGDCNNDESKFALDAQNYRIEKGTNNAKTREAILSGSKANAWDMTSGIEDTDDTTKVTVDSSLLDAGKIGVYPVTITYHTTTEPIRKIVYVTVYDETVISGPEDEDNTDPDNMRNSELLSALDAEMSIYEACER